MIVLDTDALTLLQRKEGAGFERVTHRLRTLSEQPTWVTIVSFEEQMRGWLAFIAGAKSPEKQVLGYAYLRSLMEGFHSRPMLDFDPAASIQYQRLVKGRVRVGTMDLRIAAICLVHGASLLTMNLSDFRKVPGLKLVDWLEGAP
ncbi:MAG: type II toxin-antitoxin system VapC family toxin [Planctomycetes bacterium]|nr:type II toxin-antitoxin system VapC family toxin [Planctomycetota bacterium]